MVQGRGERTRELNFRLFAPTPTSLASTSAPEPMLTHTMASFAATEMLNSSPTTAPTFAIVSTNASRIRAASALGVLCLHRGPSALGVGHGEIIGDAAWAARRAASHVLPHASRRWCVPACVRQPTSARAAAARRCFNFGLVVGASVCWSLVVVSRRAVL